MALAAGITLNENQTALKDIMQAAEM